MIEQKTSLLKMRKQPPNRKIRFLRSYFYFRGDHLKYSETQNCTVANAIPEMEISNRYSGYRLIWRVIWEGD